MSQNESFWIMQTHGQSRRTAPSHPRYARPAPSGAGGAPCSRPKERAGRVTGPGWSITPGAGCFGSSCEARGGSAVPWIVKRDALPAHSELHHSYR